MHINHYTTASETGVLLRSSIKVKGEDYAVERMFNREEWKVMTVKHIHAARNKLDDELMAKVNATPKLVLPRVGSVWQHTNGNHYIVLHVTSEPDEEKADKFPVTVIYRRVAFKAEADGRTWPRTLPSWYGSMTFVAEAA